MTHTQAQAKQKKRLDDNNKTPIRCYREKDAVILGEMNHKNNFSARQYLLLPRLNKTKKKHITDIRIHPCPLVNTVRKAQFMRQKSTLAPKQAHTKQPYYTYNLCCLFASHFCMFIVILSRERKMK